MQRSTTLPQQAASIGASCRWQSILRQHSSSARLWRAYTSWQRTRFASFTMSALQQAHHQALAVCTCLGSTL